MTGIDSSSMRPAIPLRAIAPALLLVLGSMVACHAQASNPDQDPQALITTLCDRALGGRVVGSEGLDRAADVIATRFEQAGLKPAGDAGAWFQSFKPEGPKIADAVLLPAGAKWGAITLRNVIGVIPGSGEGRVIVGAHYDHLGRDAKGIVYPGADDNASGVAALCGIAKTLAAEPQHKRTIVFVAFSGEEEGMLGSQWYVEHPIAPLESTIAMINLDTVGRMEGRRLLVLSSFSALELPKALRGVNLGFGLDLATPEKGPIGSDHVAFLSKGVPAVHFFTGPNADYHRTTDTADKVNYTGLGEIVAFASETVRFLADRDRPLTFVPPGADKVGVPLAGAQPATPRRVSLGTIPDMTFQGEGVLISGVMPGSPAEQVGLQKGDRIVGVDGEKVSGLEDFSGILKGHKPGDAIRIRFIRDEQERTIEATLVERK